MFELFKDGVALTQSLVLLPLKAANQLLGPKNPTFGEALDIVTDMVKIPFQMLNNTIDSLNTGSEETGGFNEKSRQSSHLNLGNVFVNPEVQITEDLVQTGSLHQTRLKVTGLICDA